MGYADREVEREYQREWYRKNQDEVRARTARNNVRYARRNRLFIRRVAMKYGCQKCGYKKCFEALHFHHIGKKSFCISAAPKMKTSMKRLKDEMRQCVILCANCHAEVHADVTQLAEVPVSRTGS